MADLLISEPKPRRQDWFRSPEAEQLEREIIHHIRAAASQGSTHGTLRVEV